jgi:pyruvate-formate lyase-activating enzyme
MRKLALYWRLLGNVLQNPRYHFFVIRRNWYGRVAKQLASGEPPSEGTFYPTKLDLRIVYGCNLRCKMCGQWGDTGSYFNFDALKKQRRLEPQIIESVVKELVPHGLRFVDIEGGETFLYPNIIELFRMLKSYGLFVKPVTNGTLLKKYAKDLVESGVDAVHVSIDGDREFHNHVRQATLAYDRTLEGLAAVIDERRRAGRHTPLVVVNFTLTRHNGAIGLRKLCEELAGKGLLDVLSVKASPIWMPEKQGEEYDRLVERYFGARGLTSWRGIRGRVRGLCGWAQGSRRRHQATQASESRFLPGGAAKHRLAAATEDVRRLQVEPRAHSISDPIRRTHDRRRRQRVSLQFVYR